LCKFFILNSKLKKMTNKEIANRLVELCRAGEYEKCYSELYSPNAWSIEPAGSPFEKVQGMEAFQEKGKQWNAGIEEFYGSEVSDPVVADDYFTISMGMDYKSKESGKRINHSEICVYKVENGKIVSEQFFY